MPNWPLGSGTGPSLLHFIDCVAEGAEREGPGAGLVRVARDQRRFPHRALHVAVDLLDRQIGGIAENLSIIGKVKIHLDNGQMTID